MRPLILLRPEPGLSASATRAAALGLEVIGHPLFGIECLPPPTVRGMFDAVVVTSANAVRCGEQILRAFADVAAYAVGEATADALRAIGIEPAFTGSGGIEGLTLPEGRLLHLCGERHRPLEGEATSVPVYRAIPTTDSLPPLAGTVVAVHSPAAGERLDALAGAARHSAMIAAISPTAAAACGEGWLAVRSAPNPDDQSLLALAAGLCQSPSR